MGLVNDQEPVAKKPRKDVDATEWYRVHRPRRLKDVIGQPEAVKVLTAKLRDGFPHVLMLTGPSGCGKTTIARIIAEKLGCSDADFEEINCASMVEPINTIRRIERGTRLSPRNGDCSVWCLDEVQSLSRAGFAQQSMLSILENTPKHCYFILATTDPQKLLPAIRTRCTTVALRSLTDKELKEVIRGVSVKTGEEYSEEVIDRVVDCSNGSARQAVVLLQQVSGLSVEDQLATLEPPTLNKAAFDLVKLLVWEKPNWEKVRAFLADLQEDPEMLRRLILANAVKELLKPKGNHLRAASIIDFCKEPWFDSPQARLAHACYEVLR